MQSRCRRTIYTKFVRSLRTRSTCPYFRSATANEGSFAQPKVRTMKINLKTVRNAALLAGALTSIIFVNRQDHADKSPHQAVEKNIQQFTSGGHILAFAPGHICVAAGSHALKVEFLNAHTTNPISTHTPDKGAVGNPQRATPLSQVSYPNLWGGVTLS